MEGVTMDALESATALAVRQVDAETLPARRLQRLRRLEEKANQIRDLCRGITDRRREVHEHLVSARQRLERHDYDARHMSLYGVADRRRASAQVETQRMRYVQAIADLEARHALLAQEYTALHQDLEQLSTLTQRLKDFLQVDSGLPSLRLA
jgi:hypothetical protein